MTRKFPIWIPAALIGAAVLGGYLWWLSRPLAPLEPATPSVAPVVTTTTATVAPPAPLPLVQLQLDPALADPPLPSIDDSDTTLRSAVVARLGETLWQALFQPNRMIRRIVATIDNLPRADAPVNMWPLKPAGGWLITQQTPPGAVLLADANQRRYDAHVALLGKLDADWLVTLYLRHYPLLQQAYEELGYPDAIFHDRLRVAIDDLLATPEVTEPLTLLPDKVRYRFADPDLDRRSAGQKILLRIGQTHARTVKTKLIALRTALARHEVPVSTATSATAATPTTTATTATATSDAATTHAPATPAAAALASPTPATRSPKP